MKIKIIKSSSPAYWYANHVGETFELKKRQLKRYTSRELGYDVIRKGVNKGVRYFVKTSDCEII
jgi:hypothetical protein